MKQTIPNALYFINADNWLRELGALHVELDQTGAMKPTITDALIFANADENLSPESLLRFSRELLSCTTSCLLTMASNADPQSNSATHFLTQGAA